jgi:hypothetical protein
MTIKANGRSALILATGLFAGLLVCLAGPASAAATADDAAASSAPGAPLALNKDVKHAAHHWKKVAHHKSSKLAEKSTTGTKATDDGDNSTAVGTVEIPPSVANANAQLAQADSPSGSAQAMSARANTMLQAAPDQPADTPPAAATEVVSADQLNDVDRALHQSDAPKATLVMASADAPAVVTRNENSTWDQTSLIGKIFIGFGALLTMASAARMFMA